MVQTVTKITIPELSPTHSGKVRDIFDLGDTLLLVASDRLSAFDCILPQGIPEKGAILTQMAKFWFVGTVYFSGILNRENYYVRCRKMAGFGRAILVILILQGTWW